jgi:hypothetical protein
LKSYRVSLFLVAGLVVLAIAARPVSTAVSAVAGPRFLSILSIAIVGAVLLLGLIRAIRERSGNHLPCAVLAAATVLFVLVSRPLPHLQLLAAACFLLGVFVFLESRRSSWEGLALIVVAALAVSGAVLLRSGGRFLPMDAWIYLLAGLSGYCAAPLRRR